LILSARKNKLLTSLSCNSTSYNFFL
jgi:hypothetical protein